jgi:hypothetical protein
VRAVSGRRHRRARWATRSLWATRGLITGGQVLDGDRTRGAFVGAADDGRAGAATVGVLQLLAELAAPPAGVQVGGEPGAAQLLRERQRVGRPVLVHHGDQHVRPGRASPAASACSSRSRMRSNPSDPPVAGHVVGLEHPDQAVVASPGGDRGVQTVVDDLEDRAGVVGQPARQHRGVGSVPPGTSPTSSRTRSTCASPSRPARSTRAARAPHRRGHPSRGRGQRVDGGLRHAALHQFARHPVAPTLSSLSSATRVDPSSSAGTP